jgi:hypothetical protein
MPSGVLVAPHGSTESTGWQRSPVPGSSLIEFTATQQ